jgi:hypothetical protein
MVKFPVVVIVYQFKSIPFQPDGAAFLHVEQCVVGYSVVSASQEL